MLEKLKRWVKFNIVGGAGMLVQLFLLSFFTEGLEIHYLLATLLAVEGAILHNYVWHELWTWKDKRSTTGRAMVSRLFRFHLANGTTSITGNLILMKLGVGFLHLPILAANLIAIAACSIINFALSDSLVFRLEGHAEQSSPDAQSFYPCGIMARTREVVEVRSTPTQINSRE